MNHLLREIAPFDETARARVVLPLGEVQAFSRGAVDVDLGPLGVPAESFSSRVATPESAIASRSA